MSESVTRDKGSESERWVAGRNCTSAYTGLDLDLITTEERFADRNLAVGVVPRLDDLTWFPHASEYVSRSATVQIDLDDRCGKLMPAPGDLPDENSSPHHCEPVAHLYRPR